MIKRARVWLALGAQAPASLRRTFSPHSLRIRGAAPRPQPQRRLAPSASLPHERRGKHAGGVSQGRRDGDCLQLGRAVPGCLRGEWCPPFSPPPSPVFRCCALCRDMCAREGPSHAKQLRSLRCKWAPRVFLVPDQPPLSAARTAAAAAVLARTPASEHACGASRLPLRLRGGGVEGDLASSMQRSVNGVITADEAVTLSKMGFLKGAWQAESEVEPDSDVQVLLLLVWVCRASVCDCHCSHARSAEYL